MALDQRRKQKKAEKRNAKQKAKKKEMARRDREDPSIRFARAVAAPILHSAVSMNLWEGGIGYVLLSRQMAGGNVASALFLVDVYCLGVKDALYRISPADFYQSHIYNKIHYELGFVDLPPESARKLVEGAVDFALRIGMEPHPDYVLARMLFGDIDPGLSTDKFVYGKNGKPLFVAGPYDSPQKCGRIMDLLMKNCGPGKFDYLVPLMGPGESKSTLQSLFLDHEGQDEDDEDA